MSESLTHFNHQGRARMVDITEKQVTERIAVVCSRVTMKPETLERIKEGRIGKGDVLAVAQVAGVMAAKKTSDLIPMCHPLALTGVDIRFSDNEKDTLYIEVAVKTKGMTGVEMEALTAASVTGLTIYDMCKAMDKEMIIGPTYLVSKTGGKSGDVLYDVDIELVKKDKNE
jgi:cyclic pyranopterin phosphate synthase